MSTTNSDNSDADADADASDVTPGLATYVTNDTPVATRIQRFKDRIALHQFRAWHQMAENRRNLEEGYGHSRNNPKYEADDKSHSPSSLLQCHRKIWYRSKNAPREYPLPYGVFITGHWIEEDLIEPWLREDILEHDEYILNAGHVTYTEDGLTFSGSHDPALADRHGQPFAFTEVKSTGSDPHFIKGPKDHHKAQAHAYMQGMVEEHDALDDHPPAFVIYVQKDSLDIFPYVVEFDQEFWDETVMPWARKNTGYRAADILPPAKPYMGQDDEHTKNITFECNYCDFRNRCGNFDPNDKNNKWDETVASKHKGSFQDQHAKGFLPLTNYPAKPVVEHLAAHPDVKLTPTLAYLYPEFVLNVSEKLKQHFKDPDTVDAMRRRFGSLPAVEVHDWVCDGCDETYAYDAFEWDADLNDTPTCPSCKDTEGHDMPLRGPRPDEQ